MTTRCLKASKQAKRQATEDGKAPIYVRITIDGTDTDISLGKKIHPDFWNSDAKLVSATTAEAKMINLKSSTHKQRSRSISRCCNRSLIR